MSEQPAHLDTPDAIRTDGLVPIYSSGDSSVLHRIAVALAKAGLSTFEVALRTPGALGALAAMIESVDAGGVPVAVGAGTVLDVATAEAAVDAGARFVFSPSIIPEVAAVCRDANVPYIPGCATPTEIHRALELECTMVKLFPADTIGGPGFLRAVRPVFPQLAAIPSGGVSSDPDVLRGWFDAGAVAVAMGSQLFPPGVIDAASNDELEQRLSTVAATVRSAREGPQP